MGGSLDAQSRRERALQRGSDGRGALAQIKGRKIECDLRYIDFNDGLDRWVLGPVARGWDFVLPEFALTGLDNFFRNWEVPRTFLNDLFQAKPRPAAHDLGRFVVNTTVGVVGLFGDNIRGLFGGGSESLAGSPSVGNPGQEAQKTEWTLRGGSLSAYGNSNGYNPGGTSDAPQSAPDPGGGFNPGGSSGDRHYSP